MSREEEACKAQHRGSYKVRFRDERCAIVQMPCSFFSSRVSPLDHFSKERLSASPSRSVSPTTARGSPREAGDDVIVPSEDEFDR